MKANLLLRITIFLLIYCTCAHAQPTLDNDDFHIVFGKERQVETLRFKKVSISLPSANIAESVVFDEGSTVKVTGYRLIDSNENQVVFEAMLPASPLIGKVPSGEIEIPWFRQDDTTKLQLRKTYRFSDDGGAIVIAYELTNTGGTPTTAFLQFERSIFPVSQSAKVFLPTQQGVVEQDATRWEYDTPQSWIARRKDNSIVLFEFEQDKTSCITGNRANERAGAVTTQITLKPGETWLTQTSIRLFTNLARIDAYVDGNAIELRTTGSSATNIKPDLDKLSSNSSLDDDIFAIEQEKPKLSILSLLPQFTTSDIDVFAVGKSVRIGITAAHVSPSASLLATIRPLGESTGQTLKLTRSNAGQLTNYKSQFTPKTKGTYILTLRQDDGAEQIHLGDHTIIIGEPSGIHLPSIASAEKHAPIFERFHPQRFRKPSKFDGRSTLHAIDYGIQTPHTPLGKPLADGPLKVLACVPFQAARKMVELHQRLDCEFDVVMFDAVNHIDPTDTRKEILALRASPDEVRQMRAALNRDHEAILYIAAIWDYYPEDIQFEILRQVAEEGTGLVFVSPIALPRTFHEQWEHRVAGHDVFKERVTFGKGQIAFVDPGFPHFIRNGDIFSRDTDARQRTCHALLQAARGPLAIDIELPAATDYSQLRSVDLTNHSNFQFEGNLQVIALRTSGIGVEYHVRAFPYYDEIGRTTQQISLPPNRQRRISFKPVSMPSGDCRVLLVVRDANNSVINWHAADLVNNTQAIAIENLQLLPVKPSGPIRLSRHDRARVTFEATSNRPIPVVTAKVTGQDVSGRTIFEEVVQPPTGTNSFVLDMEVSLELALHLALRVQVQLLRGEDLVAQESILATIDPADRFETFRFRQLDNEYWFPFHLGYIDDFVRSAAGSFAQFDALPTEIEGYFIPESWQSEQEIEAAERAKKVAEAKARAEQGLAVGVDMVGGGDLGDDLFDTIDEVDKAESKARQAESDKPKLVRHPCFNNPTFRKYQLQRARDAAGQPGVSPRIMAVDEFLYDGNACQCSHCVAAFADYLKRSYGSVANLNQHWQSAHRKWTDAKLWWFEEGDPLPDDKHWPRVVDTLMFKAWQHADFLTQLWKAGRAVDANFAIGHSGAYKMSFNNGIDFHAMAKAGNYHGMYRDVHVWQSLAGPANAFGWQSGYGRMYNPSHQAVAPWQLLAAGTPGVGNYTDHAYPMAGPGGKLFDGPQAFFDQFEQLQRGPAKLLLEKKVHDPIAIYFSTPSFYAYGMERWQQQKKRDIYKPHPAQGDSVIDWPRSSGNILRGQIKRIKDFEPYYVGYGDVAAGQWGVMGKPRVLVLPYVTAMSEAEAAHLRKFVEEGGMLIGTVNTEARSEHGKVWDQPLLNDVFGIEREGPHRMATMLETATDSNTRVTIQLPDRDRPLQFIPTIAGSGNVKATTAKVLGTWGNESSAKPAMLVNQFGKGTAVYLNFLIVRENEILGVKQDVQAYHQLREIVNWCLAQQLDEPFTTFQASDDRVRLSRFEDGEQQYAIVLAPTGLPSASYEQLNCKLHLQEKRHVYHLQSGEYLGFVDQLPVEFVKRKAQCFAFLSYKVQSLNTGSQLTARQGEVVSIPLQVTTDGAQPGRHVIRVDVIDPNGQPVRVLGYNQVAPNGKATIELPLSQNAPTGNWRVELRDVATGIKCDVQLRVVPQ